jgi:hypothetical protein
MTLRLGGRVDPAEAGGAESRNEPYKKPSYI